uniref:peptidoglycan-binding domain-containing protein n=1 Tax=Nocardia concava TaxID=257281 RepID=UPI003570E336
MQSFLRFNYGNGDLTVDGKFGARTKSALVNFQRSAGLTADGVAGAHTWQAIANDCVWRGDCDYKYPGALPD